MKNQQKLKKLEVEYDALQKLYGAEDLNSIYNGGDSDHPKVCFIFMNPTGRNIASDKAWKGIRAPWLGTKNIWKLFTEIGLFDPKLMQEIKTKRAKDWDPLFAKEVYQEVAKNHIFITNLGKCTQVDARALKDEVLKSYLALLEQEIDIIKPQMIIAFGNQVSSIFLHQKISVSSCRKKYFEKKIGTKTYKVFPVFYPVGNGTFHYEEAVEDLNEIIATYLDPLEIK